MKKPSLPEEHGLELHINGLHKVTLICTNEDLEELVTGYLYNEGLVSSRMEISFLRIASERSRAEIALARALPERIREVRTSGFGGVQLCDQVELEPRPVGRVFSEQYIRDSTAAMNERAVKYAATGGMHCSALFDGRRMLAVYEDIGRHNTLDKITGCCLLRGLDPNDTLLVTSGRISSDMVRKAGRMGVSVIASYSTPTDSAYSMAEAAGITLIGYLRKSPLHVYSLEQRIVRN